MYYRVITDELQHSEFKNKAWEKKDHKYIDKYKSKAGKWVYVYPNKLQNVIDTKVTGKAYKNEAERQAVIKRQMELAQYANAKNAKENAQIAESIRKSLPNNSEQEITKKQLDLYRNANRKEAISNAQRKSAAANSKAAFNAGQKQKQAEENYATKSLAGKISKSVSDIKNKDRRTVMEQWQDSVEQRKKDMQKWQILSDRETDAKNWTVSDVLEKAGVKKKTRGYTNDEDMRAVNPNFPQKDYNNIKDIANGDKDLYDIYDSYEEYEEAYDRYLNTDPGYSNNCYNCSIMYDLRKRGYDATAIWDDNGDAHEIYSELYNNPKINESAIDKRDDLDWVNSDLVKYPDGSRGHFNVQWGGDSGHSVVWSKEGGKVVIRDCQTGTKYDDIYDFYDKNGGFVSCNYYRTDDCEINENVLAYMYRNEYTEINYKDYYKYPGYYDFDEIKKKRRKAVNNYNTNS